MKRVHILHLRASNFVGGPERQLLRYAAYEADGPVHVTLGSFVGRKEGREFLHAASERRIETMELPGDSGTEGKALFALMRYLRENRVALLCTHGYKADILGVLAGRMRGVPVACFLRGWTAEDAKVRLYEAMDRMFLRAATRIVCLSQTQARRVGGNSALRDKIRIVPNAADVPPAAAAEHETIRKELRQRFAAAAGQPVVAIAGRLSPEKGAADFLEAAVQVRREFPGAVFVVFGDGPLRASLERQAEQLGLGQSVRFAGFVPNAARYFAGVDVLVNPSLSEEMPNVVLESMAAGVPLVATNVGAVAEIAGPEGTVALIPPANPPAMAGAIARWLQNPERAQAAGCAARERVQQAYSPEIQRRSLRALYQEFVPELRPAYEAPVSAEQPESLPVVSVVVPVRNEEARLGLVLEDLLAQDYPPSRFEILIADGESTDGTRDVVQQYKERSPVRIECFANPARLSSAGRNVGARNARGEYIVFVDGHCRILGKTFLQDTARLFRETGADCLCRPQPLDVPGNTWFQDVIADVRATRIAHGSDSTIYGSDGAGFVDPTSSGASYRATVFQRVGYYDERFDACEDVEFNHRVQRAGMRSYWSPEIAVHYSPRKSLGGLWKQLVRYGRGRFRFARKHPQALTLSQLVPAGFVAWMVLGAAGSVWFAPVRWLWLATLLLYAAIVLASSLGLGLRRGPGHLILAPVVYLVIHTSLGAGYWMEVLLTLFGRSGAPVGADASVEVPPVAANQSTGRAEVRDSAEVAAPKS
jgi:glycosyltransferase involved in cell wall biosynthesis